MKLICTKCFKVREMEKVFYGKKEDEFSWYCSNCDDKISKAAVISDFSEVKYCEKHDAKYHTRLNIWLEDSCGSADCEFCNNRPAKPSEVIR